MDGMRRKRVEGRGKKEEGRGKKELMPKEERKIRKGWKLGSSTFSQPFVHPGMSRFAADQRQTAVDRGDTHVAILHHGCLSIRDFFSFSPSALRSPSMSSRIKAMFKRKSGGSSNPNPNPTSHSPGNSLERGAKLWPEDAIPDDYSDGKGLFASLLKNESVRRLVDESEDPDTSESTCMSPVLLNLTDEEKAATLSGAVTVAARRGRSRGRKKTYDMDALRPLQRSLSKFQTVEELQQYGHKQPIVAEELSDMIFYTRAVKFTRFAVHDDENPRPKYVYETSSFNESTALRLAQRRLNKFTQHNMYKLTRVYPIGRRYISSNFNPIPMWAAGCQLVAMNWQTLDDNMLVNHAMFRLNGKSGYVLKPATMRSVTLLNSYLFRDRPRFR